MLKSPKSPAPPAPSAPLPASSPAPLPAPARARPSRRGSEAASGPSIALLQAHSLPGLVQRELARMILAGEIAPGEKLNEAALAERLGVSRGPVREAFRALEESGLVRPEKNRGVYVRQIPREEADAIYELRAVLDEFVGRRVAATAREEDLPELRGLVQRMDKAAARDDVDTFFALNLAFHDRLVELAGNPKLLDTYRRLVNELRLFRRTNLAQRGALSNSAREHLAIIERIAARDADGAGRALHDHVMASRERMHRSTPADAPQPRTASRKSP